MKKWTHFSNILSPVQLSIPSFQMHLSINTSAMSPQLVMLATLFSFILFATHISSCVGQSANGNQGRGRGRGQLSPVEPGDPEFNRRQRNNCSRDYRTYDGTCTNNRIPVWASAGTPLLSYLPQHSSKTPTGEDLPSARHISNVVCQQTGDVFNRRHLSEFVVFFGQFLDHTIVGTASNMSEPFDIPIPSDDPIFGNFSNGVLPFRRNVRGVAMDENGAERAINIVSSAIDLSSVYSSDQDRAQQLREVDGPFMKTSPGNMLPFNDGGFVNAPTTEARFFLAGDHRANEHPVLTSIHTLFLREHNLLCDELISVFPDWSQERIFDTARKINGAQMQKIVFEEWYPQMTGRTLGRYRTFRKKVNPAVSDVFSVAAYRVGHTMVGNSISRRGPGMSAMSPLLMHEMFFQPVHVMTNGIEDFIRGAVFQRAQEVDTQVSSSLRNFLFTGIGGEDGFDLISMNIQRGRDDGLPSYNEIRELFGRSPARRFSDITRNRALQSKLHTAYQTVERVEAWVGLMAEDHVRAASMGPTMLQIWNDEFTRMRDGDRFHYQKPNLFSPEVRIRFLRLREIMEESETMKKIILRNTDITEADLPGSIWRASG